MPSTSVHLPTFEGTCAPRDLNKIGDVNYPQNKEESLNKFHVTLKNKRNNEGEDNLTIRN